MAAEGIVDNIPVGTDEDFYDRYDQRQVLGHGLASVVYLCVHKDSGEKLAAKVIEKAKLKEESLEEVRSEIRTLRTLGSHPNVISLLDVIDTPSATYLIFPLATGGELFDELTRSVFFTEDRAKAVMRQVFEGLSYIHKKGFVHRDIKPENILLSESRVDHVLLSDFGISTAIGSPFATACGTPGYMPPETIAHFRGASEDASAVTAPAVDAWAAGVVLYTLLVGFPPFWSSSRSLLMRMIERAKVPFDARYWDAISTPAKELVRALLQRKPHERMSATDALRHEWFATTTPSTVSSVSSATTVVTATIASTVVTAPPTTTSTLFLATLTLLRFVIRLRAHSHPPTPTTFPPQSPPAAPPSTTTTAAAARLLLPTPTPLRVQRHSLYLNMRVRKQIDRCAFQLYSHWVKKGNNDRQSRATLYENEILLNYR